MPLQTTIDDILASPTARSLPKSMSYEVPTLGNQIRAMENFYKVFAIRKGDHVLFLADPALDPRIIQAVHALARARGAEFELLMSTDRGFTEGRVPEEARPYLERATFVVATWFASIFDPYCLDLRRLKGQRWVKITFFRNWDMLNTPQARFPVELVGELIRATARLWPTEGPIELRITDPRGGDFRIAFTDQMLKEAIGHSRWRGTVTADSPGAYVHFLPIHGPNLYDRSSGYTKSGVRIGINGIVYPQWAVGFEKPFREKIGVEFKDDLVVAVHGESPDAQLMRDFIIGGTLEELGCGHAPKAARFEIYPAGPNSPGALHWGINGPKTSDHLRKTLPGWEEPYVHFDMVTFDSTVRAGESVLVQDGFLRSLRDPDLVKAAAAFGDPVDLLENFPS